MSLLISTQGSTPTKYLVKLTNTQHDEHPFQHLTDTRHSKCESINIIRTILASNLWDIYSDI